MGTRGRGDAASLVSVIRSLKDLETKKGRRLVASPSSASYASVSRVPLPRVSISERRAGPASATRSLR